MLNNIVLPAGTNRLTVREVPRLFAIAVHPKPENNLRALTDVMKVKHAPEAMPAPRAEELTAADWDTLGAIWHHLPRFKKGISEAEFSQYVKSFNNAKYKPDWELVPFICDAGLNARILQMSAEDEYKKMVADAIASGELIALSPLTFAPDKTAQGGQPQNLIVTVDALKDYASHFHIGIQEAAPVEQAAPKLEAVTDTPPAPADKDTNQNDDVEWKVKARAIADECFDHDTSMNCRDSLKGYSGRVMDIMQKREIKGPRGTVGNPGTIMRDALQGGKWWANKKK